MEYNKLVVYGKVRPQGRPRFTSKPFPHAYENKNDKEYKELIIKTCKQEIEQGNIITLENIEKPLDIKLRVYAPYPSGLTKLQKKLINNLLYTPPKKQDVDNFAKIVIDALTGIAWLADDTNILKLEVTKEFVEKDKERIELLYKYLEK